MNELNSRRTYPRLGICALADSRIFQTYWDGYSHQNSAELFAKIKVTRGYKYELLNPIALQLVSQPDP